MEFLTRKITDVNGVEQALPPFESLIRENMEAFRDATLFGRLHEGLRVVSQAIKMNSLASLDLLVKWFDLYVEIQKFICPRITKIRTMFNAHSPYAINIALRIVHMQPTNSQAHVLLEMIKSLLMTASINCISQLLKFRHLTKILFQIMCDAGDIKVSSLVLRMMILLLKCCDSKQRVEHMEKITQGLSRSLIDELQAALKYPFHQDDRNRETIRHLMNLIYTEKSSGNEEVFAFRCSCVAFGHNWKFYKTLDSKFIWIDLKYQSKTMAFSGCCKLTGDQVIDVSLTVSKITMSGNKMTVQFERPGNFSKPLCDLEDLKYQNYVEIKLSHDELVRIMRRDDVIRYFNGENPSFYTNRQRIREDCISEESIEDDGEFVSLYPTGVEMSLYNYSSSRTDSVAHSTAIEPESYIFISPELVEGPATNMDLAVVPSTSADCRMQQRRGNVGARTSARRAANTKALEENNAAATTFSKPPKRKRQSNGGNRKMPNRNATENDKENAPPLEEVPGEASAARNESADDITIFLDDIPEARVGDTTATTLPQQEVVLFEVQNLQTSTIDEPIDIMNASIIYDSTAVAEMPVLQPFPRQIITIPPDDSTAIAATEQALDNVRNKYEQKMQECVERYRTKMDFIGKYHQQVLKYRQRVLEQNDKQAQDVQKLLSDMERAPLGAVCEQFNKDMENNLRLWNMMEDNFELLSSAKLRGGQADEDFAQFERELNSLEAQWQQEVNELT